MAESGFKAEQADKASGRGTHWHGIVDSGVVHTGAHCVLHKAPLEKLQRLRDLLLEILCRLVGNTKVKVVGVEPENAIKVIFKHVCCKKYNCNCN